MKISKRSILALAMAAVLLLAVFAGCTSASPSAAVSPSPSKAASPSPSQATPAPEAGMEGWEPFAQNVKLMVPVYDRAKEGYPPVEDNYWTKWVQAEFGDKWNVTVEYVPIPRWEQMATYSMLIAGKITPTIMMEYDYPKVAEWASTGAMATINLDDFAFVAPNYYQAMVDNNQLDYTDINGKTYFVLTERAYYDTTYTYATLVRQDWLDTLGKSNPKSYAEWTDVMDGIIANGLTKGGAPFGFLLPADTQVRNYSYRDFPVNEEEWALHSSLGTASLTWEPTKRYIQRLNSEYNKGYISKEFDLDKDDGAGGSSQWQTDFVNGKVYNFGGYMSANVDWLKAFYENNPGATLAIESTYRYVEPGVAVAAQIRADNPFGMIVGFSSYATEDELKAAWMYMEWMHSGEVDGKGVLSILENGIEGVTFVYDANGLPVVDGAYRGEEMLNHNMNIDMTCVVHAVKKTGDIEQTIKGITPQSLPQDFYQDLVNNYYELKEISNNGAAVTDPVYSVTFDSEGEYNGTLKSLWPEYLAALIKCKPEEFDAKYDDYSKKYLDAGYQAILDERLAAYKAGNFINPNKR